MLFHKYHALGNDYIVLNPADFPYWTPAPTVAQIRAVCHRNFGVGSDGILWGPLPSQKSQFALRIFNPDGSEAEKSGNGLRIFSRFLLDQKLVTTPDFTIETPGGNVRSIIKEDGRLITVAMGRVSFDSDKIPVAIEYLGHNVAQTAKSASAPAKGRANPPGEPPLETAQPEASPYPESASAPANVEAASRRFSESESGKMPLPLHTPDPASSPSALQSFSPSFNAPLRVLDRDFTICAATIGNPHCVIPLPAAEVTPETAHRYGPHFETHPAFPRKTNVQFLHVIDRANIRIEIWERGAGYTLASGSSSSAAAAVAHRLGLVDRDITVHMPGGIITIEIGDNYDILMTGPVTKVSTGKMSAELFT